MEMSSLLLKIFRFGDDLVKPGHKRKSRCSSAVMHMNIWWLDRQRAQRGCRDQVRSCPQCHLPSVCLIGGRHSYKLRSCFHLATRRRACSNVLARVSCALTTAAEAPPPYRQKRVCSVHTRHQEAKDLQTSGKRKENVL